MNWHDLTRQIRKSLAYGREVGWSELVTKGVNKLSQQYSSAFAKKNLLTDFEFVQYKPIGAAITPEQVSSKTLNWVVPPFSRGAGGHLNIFRYIYHLEGLGFDSRIIIEGQPQPTSAEQAELEIRKMFFPVKAKVYLGVENAPPAHITLATNWQTAYAVRNFQSCLHRIYFAQDFEPWFHPRGTEYTFAEQTYSFGFVGITAGQWLASKLSSEYGMTTFSIGFSYDVDLYRPMPRRKQPFRQIFFYARPHTERRGFELGLMVFQEVIRRLPDVRVVFAGADLSTYEIPFNHIDLGTLSIKDLPDLYNQCDLALVISFSNLSLLPLEIMACGVPVVSNRAPHTTWLLNDENAKLAEPTVHSLAQAICELLGNPIECERLGKKALSTAQATSWSNEAERLAHLLVHLDTKETHT